MWKEVPYLLELTLRLGIEYKMLWQLLLDDYEVMG